MSSKIRLTESQARMLATLASGDTLPPYGRSDSGRQASAWWRTVRSLWRQGLVDITSAYLPDARRLLFRVRRVSVTTAGYKFLEALPTQNRSD